MSTLPPCFNLSAAAWPCLPLILRTAGATHLPTHVPPVSWLLYGKNLNQQRLIAFQQQLNIPLIIVSIKRVADYYVLRMAGALTKKMCVIADAYQLDIALLKGLPQLHTPGLLVMDMDSTAIQIECIDEIAWRAGFGPEVAAITERAMQGQCDFAASLRQRVALLKGVDVALLQEVAAAMPLTDGLRTLVDKLHAVEWRIALASGGFSYYAQILSKKLSLAAIAANRLEIQAGKLTGQVLGPIVDAAYKAAMLRKWAKKWAISLQQTVAIGDGANDSELLQAAGYGIAFHAKAALYAKANAAIRHGDLMSLFCILTGGQGA